MPFCPSQQQFEHFLAGRLSADEQDTLCEHVEVCHACQKTIDALTAKDAHTPGTEAREPGQVGAFMERLKHSPPESTEMPRSGPSPASAADEDWRFLDPPAQPGQLGRLGHYQIHSLIGRGGMGLVFKAFDEILQRVVAVKVLAPQFATSATARQRFLREARAAAAVSHDHVVTIHAVEENNGVPYLVMQLVVGVSLQGKLDRVGTLPADEVLRIGLQTARGLAAAHAQGLIHRDIKPANLLLENGIERVKITDFGLARAVDDASLTQSGVVAGTPLYMSPEQAAGEAIDHRADLFSLGSVLYAMCTGRPPFRAGGTVAVLKRVCEDAPRPIREINHEIPEGLAEVVACLHEKDAAQRYQSAAEVAEDLAHLLAARQSGTAIEPSRGRRRPAARPGEASTVEATRVRSRKSLRVAAAVVLLISVAAGLAYWWRPADGTDSPDPPVNAVKAPLSPAELAKLPSPFDQRKRDEIAPEFLALLGDGDPNAAPPELVTVLGDAHFYLPPTGMAGWMDQSPDGKILAVPRAKDVFLFETPSGKHVRTLKGPAQRITFAKFSPDGKLLASSVDRNFSRIWQVDTGKEVLTLEIPTQHAPEHRVMIIFSPDSKRLITAVRERIQVWDVPSGKELQAIEQDTAVESMAFRPGKNQLAIGTWQNKNVVIWDWDGDKLKELRTLDGHTTYVGQVLYSPDGKWLASADVDTTKLWDAETLREIRSIATTLGKLDFSPDSRTLYVAPLHTRVYTRWDLAGKDEFPPMTIGGIDEIEYPYLSRDGKTRYVAELHSVPYVRVLDAASGKEEPRRQHSGPVRALAVSPDGRTLASGGMDHAIKLWDLAGWKTGSILPSVHTLKDHAAPVWSLAFSPDSTRMISTAEDGTAVLWDTKRQAKEMSVFTGLSKSKPQAAFSPDGKLLAATSADGSVRLWDAESGVEKANLRWQAEPVRTLAFSSDGRHIACAGERVVSVGEFASGRKTRTLQPGAAVAAIAFSPDGRTLACAVADAAAGLRLWDVESGNEKTLNDNVVPAVCLAYHPAGTLLALGLADGRVRFVDPATGAATTIALKRPVTRIVFTREGRYLATASDEGIIAILRVPGNR